MIRETSWTKWDAPHERSQTAIISVFECVEVATQYAMDIERLFPDVTPIGRNQFGWVYPYDVVTKYLTATGFSQDAPDPQQDGAQDGTQDPDVH